MKTIHIYARIMYTQLDKDAILIQKDIFQHKIQLAVNACASMEYIIALNLVQLKKNQLQYFVYVYNYIYIDEIYKSFRKSRKKIIICYELIVYLS